ncbi:hypothetical protein PGB90_000195 [Kerria lacca]
MNVFELFFTFCALYCVTTNATPVKRIDQRQDGDLNIQAHLDKIVLLIVPNKNINILDIKGQGPFDNYEDLLPLLGKENVNPNAINDVKYKLTPDDVKIKTLASVVTPELLHKEDKKELAKIESPKQEPKEQKDFKKPVDVRETTPKKIESEVKTVPVDVQQTQQKKVMSKSDGRTYQTVHSANNRERVIAISSQETEQKKITADVPVTKIEKL